MWAHAKSSIEFKPFTPSENMWLWFIGLFLCVCKIENIRQIYMDIDTEFNAKTKFSK